MVFHVFYKVIANLPWINNGINIKAEINLKNKGYTDALMDRIQIQIYMDPIGQVFR